MRGRLTVGRGLLVPLIQVRILAPQPSFAKAKEWLVCFVEHSMFYCYIILCSSHHLFYVGSTKDLKDRLEQHNAGKVESTKAYKPWKLAWYGAFRTRKEAEGFENYLKSGSGRAFAYKRLVPVALKKDLCEGRSENPELLAEDD